MLLVVLFIFLFFNNTVASSSKVKDTKSRSRFGKKNSRSLMNGDEKIIDRQDILMWLTSPDTKRPVPLKLVRRVNSVDDLDYYSDEPTTVPTSEVNVRKNDENKKKDIQDGTASSLNRTHHLEVEGGHPIRISLKVTGIIVLVTMLLSCCCTLYLRNILMKIITKLTGKKKKSKLIPADSEKGHSVIRKKVPFKKLQTKEKKQPCYDMIHVATQDNIGMVPTITTAPTTPTTPTAPTIPTRDQAMEQQTTTPTGCYKCYKKKRRRKVKKSRKQ